ncbi:MAG: DNA-protecting protein DprA [Pleurocapsa minor GSE-CHR-MK-17-07R]|jgi:DNA processing protein|nr:DNA-protecting protein DprA [Pleurocapsa minor GSE-CHR-MK 17-07R]
MSDLAWLAAAVTGRFNASAFDAFYAHFEGDAGRMQAADEAGLMRLRGIGPRTAAALRAIDYEVFAHRAEAWAKQGVRWVLSGETTQIFGDVAHPLAGFAERPAAMFWRGLTDVFHDGQKRVGIVGTRSPGLAARLFAEQIAYDAGRTGATIVSGLALGVDTLAHEGALTAGTRTIAVLGGGVLDVYPPENIPLAARLMACGALVCEVPPDVTVARHTLVARNRLIAAFCDALVVVETESNGGAMYAARRALAPESGTRVFALDLPASGNQALLAEGALPLPAGARVDVAQLLA